ncbi:MAG: hypothetical protein AB8G05_25710 [Oligoflexales bacterium]
MQPKKYPTVLVNEFRDSAIELGSLYGFNLSLENESHDPGQYEQAEQSAFSALISNKLSGFVGLVMSKQSLSASSPVSLNSENDFLEWNKELLNIYAGLLKMRLYKFSIEMVISLPNECKTEDFKTFEEGVGPILSMKLKANDELLTTFLFSFSIGRNVSFEAEKEASKTHTPGSGIVF